MFESFFKKFKALLKCKVYMIKIHVKHGVYIKIQYYKNYI